MGHKCEPFARFRGPVARMCRIKVIVIVVGKIRPSLVQVRDKKETKMDNYAFLGCLLYYYFNTCPDSGLSFYDGPDRFKLLYTSREYCNASTHSYEVF